jgi:DNA-directed RNA polymerase specialized sigma24 family protein
MAWPKGKPQPLRTRLAVSRAMGGKPKPYAQCVKMSQAHTTRARTQEELDAHQHSVRVAWQRRKEQGVGAWTDAEEKRALHMRDVLRFSYAKIGERLDRSEAAIKSHFRTLRNRARTGNSGQRRREREAQRRETFISMWNDGATIEAIAEALDMKRASVSTRRAELGLEPRLTSTAESTATDHHARVRAHWIKQGLSKEEAALRASILTTRGAAIEAALLRKGMTA